MRTPDEQTKLEKWVKAQDFKVATIAAMFGCGRVALHRAMAGEVIPRPATAQTIARVTKGAVTGADLAADYHRRRSVAA